MDILEKLQILGAAAKYDVSCASSGSKRETNYGMGSTFSAGICHSWTDDGRCISLLKILFTNECLFDCAYCINKKSNDIKRATFTPNEVAELTINFYKRNYIEGLFLSSAIKNSPDWTMEMIYNTVFLLRHQYHFNGYIHVKAIPYASDELLKKTGFLVDRMSVNIELPSEKSLRLLCPNKTKDSILKPMEFIKNYSENEKGFVSAGQSTQMIIGATDDSDYKIIHLSQSLYKRYRLKRVYYSAYTPVTSDSRIKDIKNPPLLREHRLYQADWLIRVYNFTADELLKSQEENLDLEVDPKIMWALKNMDRFPVEVNKASYEELIRVPGIGIKSAKRIVRNRAFYTLDFDHLKKIGVVLKRAKYFITCKGKTYERYLIDLPTEKIRKNLTEKYLQNDRIEQLSFFDPEVFSSVVSGEI